MMRRSEAVPTTGEPFCTNAVSSMDTLGGRQ